MPAPLQVVWNGAEEHYLVIWAHETRFDFDLLGLRLSATGSSIDDTFPITDTAAMKHEDPVTAWNGAGDEYRVVWNSDSTPTRAWDVGRLAG